MRWKPPVGNYFANRARDLGECFCVDVGGAVGVGAGVEAAGVAHVGLGWGCSPHFAAIGWEYGHAFAFGATTGAYTSDGLVETWLPFPWPIAGMGHGPDMMHVEQFRVRHGVGSTIGHWCNAALPGWLHGNGFDHAPPSLWSRVHAFDVKVSAFAGLAYVRAGFSLGELADFILGWIGLDIAGDDRPLASPTTLASGG